MRLSKKNSFFVLGLCAITFVIQAFDVVPTEKEINLSQAIENNSIIADIQSIGSYHGKSISMSLTNKTSSHLKIKIPSGTLFHPENEGEQTLIHLEDNFIALKPHSSYSGMLAGFCTEANDRCPTEGNEMKISQNKNDKFNKLANYLKDNNVSKSVYQDAIWAISDGKSIANIDASEPSSAALRKFMAVLTGQKNTWYSSPQNRHVDEGGNIVHETVVIKGQLEFDCKKNAKVRQDIYKENGESVFISEKYMTAHISHINYKFTMRVRGWEKGKYYILIHDGTDEITRYAFVV